VRDFQRQKGLRVDGLLNPGGPTIRALGRVLARPPLKGLSGAADDNSLLDKLILQARLADEEDDPTPEDPGQDDPDEPEDPPYDPGHPQPSDPDDPGEDEPDEPEGPEKPKPNKEKCEQWSQALKKTEADLRGDQSLRDSTQKAVKEKTDELERKKAAYDQALAVFAVVNGIALWEMLKGRIPSGVQLPSEVLRAKEAYETARAELEVLIDELRRAREQLDQARERVSELREQIAAAGCGT
jgi:hypothetical protein